MKKFLFLALAGTTLLPALDGFGTPLTAAEAIRIEHPVPGSRPSQISWTKDGARVVMDLRNGIIQQTIAGKNTRDPALESAFKAEVRRQMPGNDELALLVVDHKPAIRTLGL